VLLSGQQAIGTGVLVSPRGHIITNDHVVQAAYKDGPGAGWLAVWFKPEGSATQPVPGTSTVLHITSEMPQVGQDVFVIGHPKGYLWSLTHGIVSQIRPEHAWRYDDSVPRMATAIQTQAPINPGNSGGPLFGNDGSVLGIVAGGEPDAQGLFFAVAAQHLIELAP
jgi:S1-C subfamily serine protease